jgi:hypothetical protein
MKLSLRELFLLVVIAAMGCGWWVERQRFLHREEISRGNFVRYLAPLSGESIEETLDFVGEDFYSTELQPPLSGGRTAEGSENP